MSDDLASLTAQIAHLGRGHDEPPLRRADLAPDPFQQFARWMQDALHAEGPLPNAMTLATAGPDARPSARTILLKSVDPAGFVFFTNYGSRKARDLAVNRFAALLFHWPTLERQAAVCGPVERTSDEESDEYFQTRPRGSQLGAWASAQSEIIAGRDVLEQALRSVEQRFGDGPIPRPPQWGGFRLAPDEFEFWQARPNRLHDRFRYRRSSDGWTIDRLSP